MNETNIKTGVISSSTPPAKERLKLAVSCVLGKVHELKQSDLKSLRVLVRVDLNVPLLSLDDGTPQISDASRITAALPTIRLLQQKEARIILMSHFGRPDPKRQSQEDMKQSFSLGLVAERLAELLGDSFVGMTTNCIGEEVRERISSLEDGQVLLLENTRFHTGDTANDPNFAAELARNADVFVNDAFGVVHRAQASVTGVTAYISRSYPGLLLHREVEYLTQNIWTPQRPLGVALGGAKVADKIGVLWALIERADKIVIGGRMAFTFLAARGVAVGRTQIEEDWLERARLMMARAEVKGVELVLPEDVVVGRSLESGVKTAVVPLTVGCCSPQAPCVPDGCYGGDIGPASSQTFAATLRNCKTIFWNGPMGKFETPEYAEGTRSLAAAIAATSRTTEAITVVGGGDSVAAVHSLGLLPAFTHVSTGGGASLELIEGRSMPGIEALAGPPSETTR